MVDDSFRHGLAFEPSAGQDDAYLAEPAHIRASVAHDVRRRSAPAEAESDESGDVQRPARVAEVRYLHHEDASLPLARRNLDRPAARLGKRLLDVAISGALLLALSPVLAGLALWIKSSSRGPVFYRHTRVGRNGAEFNCLKFRTMVANADATLAGILATNPNAAKEWSETRKLQQDPRVTSAGRLLRRWRLDELPQLFNVLSGEMSLVGPRPVVKEELSRYGRNAVFYSMVRPGITGPWQVSAHRATSYAERIQLDSQYVINWSLSRDIVLLVQTIPAVLRGHGV